MSRRIIAVVLVVLAPTSALTGPSLAAEERASYYFSFYMAYPSQGFSPGEIILSYEVASVYDLNRLGIERIGIHREDGSFVRAEYGSIYNGLIVQNDNIAYGDWPMTISPGETYYLRVTFFGSDDNGFDRRTVETRLVTAHP